MPKQDDQQRPVKRQCCQPEILVLDKNQTSVFEARPIVAEQLTEEQYFDRHPSDCRKTRERIVELSVSNPRQRLLLTGSCRDSEGNGRHCPGDYTVAEAAKEDCGGRVRNHRVEEETAFARSSRQGGDRYHDRN